MRGNMHVCMRMRMRLCFHLHMLLDVPVMAKLEVLIEIFVIDLQVITDKCCLLL